MNIRDYLIEKRASQTIRSIMSVRKISPEMAKVKARRLITGQAKPAKTLIAPKIPEKHQTKRQIQDFSEEAKRALERARRKYGPLPMDRKAT